MLGAQLRASQQHSRFVGVVITYEYPLNERIRTLLRLEDLFERSRHFIAQPTRTTTTWRC